MNALAAIRPVLDEAPAPALAHDLNGILRLLTCGSVDDGKSTLIGRLLWDASDLYEDQPILRSYDEGRSYEAYLASRLHAQGYPVKGGH